MNHEEHVARHHVLHEEFDELMADYLRWNRDKLPSTTTLQELMVWSCAQTESPTEDGPDAAHVFAVCAHCGESVTEPATHSCAQEPL